MNIRTFLLLFLSSCEREKLLIREKHYWNIFNPEYNISQDPTAPISGRTHSEESKTKISDSLTGDNNPMFGKTGENHHNYGQPRPERAGRPPSSNRNY